MNAILGTFGIIWLLVEATSFFSENISHFFKEHWAWLLIILVIWIVYENWPKTEFSYKLKDRDIHIQLSIGNIFTYPGDLIIPINTSLDTSFEKNLISKDSTQGQFTLKYFGEPRYLDHDILSEIKDKIVLEELPNKKKGNQYKCEIGIVIKMRLSDNKFAYLTTTSNMNDDGIAYTNFDNILVGLGKLWEFVRDKGELSELNIPLIGTGRGRVKETRETIVKAIIHSFISATSSSRKFCNKLNIVIHPKDFTDHAIDINALKDFLCLKTKYYQHDANAPHAGHPIG
jgi:hypothetical protein